MRRKVRTEVLLKVGHTTAKAQASLRVGSSPERLTRSVGVLPMSQEIHEFEIK